MSLCQLGHLTRRSGRIFQRNKEYVASLSAKNDSEEIQMISDEDNETPPITIIEEENDCYFDCLEPWSAAICPFYNCLKFYDTLYLIRRRNCAFDEAGKFSNRYKDFGISNVPRPVSRPAASQLAISSPSTPRLAVSRAASMKNVGAQRMPSFQSPRRLPPNPSPSFRSTRYGIELNEI